MNERNTTSETVSDSPCCNEETTSSAPPILEISDSDSRAIGSRYVKSQLSSAALAIEKEGLDDDVIHNDDSQPNSFTLMLRAKIHALAVKNHIRALANDLSDMSFSKPVSVSMIPMIYVSSIVALSIGIFAVSINTMATSPITGLFYLLVLGPVMFLAGVFAIRALLELISTAFQVQNHTKDMANGLQKVETSMNGMLSELKGMRVHTGRLSHTISNVDDKLERLGGIINDVEGFSERIPFFKNRNRKTQRPRRWSDYQFFEKNDPEKESPRKQ